MIAVASVRVSKSIHEADVAAVKKKIKDKAFARAVNRDDMMRGAEELGGGVLIWFFWEGKINVLKKERDSQNDNVGHPRTKLKVSSHRPVQR